MGVRTCLEKIPEVVHTQLLTGDATSEGSAAHIQQTLGRDIRTSIYFINKTNKKSKPQEERSTTFPPKADFLWSRDQRLCPSGDSC